MSFTLAGSLAAPALAVRLLRLSEPLYVATQSPAAPQTYPKYLAEPSNNEPFETTQATRCTLNEPRYTTQPSSPNHTL
jgi:hypothetical protein